MVVSDQRIIKMGVIGIGAGATAMIPVFAKHPGYRWTAGCDLDPDALEAFGRDFGAQAFTDAEAMCRSADIDAVYVASPNKFHMEHILAAIEHGKHVLSEKPMTISLAEADVLIEKAEQKGVHLAVNVKHSFELRVLKLRELVTSGIYGHLRMMNTWYFNDWLYRPRTPEEMNPDWGGGVPWRQGPHQFDILRTIGGGMVRSVRGMAGTWDASRPVPGAHSAFLEFENGVVATAVYSGYDHLHSTSMVRGLPEDGPVVPPSRYARGRQNLKAVSPEDELKGKRANRYGGANRTAETSNNDSRGNSENGGGWLSGGPMVVSFDHADVWVMPAGLLVSDDERQEFIPVPDVHGDGRWGRVDSFHQALLSDESPPADGRWGKATLEVILALLESSRERREIELKHQTATADERLLVAR